MTKNRVRGYWEQDLNQIQPFYTDKTGQRYFLFEKDHAPKFHIIRQDQVWYSDRENRAAFSIRALCSYQPPYHGGKLHAPGRPTTLVSPYQVLPGEFTDNTGSLKTLGTAYHLHNALKGVVCANCLKTFTAEISQKDGVRLVDFLIALQGKCWSKLRKENDMSVGKTALVEEFEKRTRTSSSVILKLEVEFDLNDDCPKSIAEAIEAIIDAARDEGGYPQDARVISEYPLEFQITT